MMFQKKRRKRHQHLSLTYIIKIILFIINCEKKPVKANGRIFLNHNIGVLVRKVVTGTFSADMSVREIHWSSKHDRGRYQKTTEVTAVPIIAYYNTRKRVIAIFSVGCCWPDLYENGRFLGVRYADFWSNRFPVAVHKWVYTKRFMRYVTTFQWNEFCS